MAVIWKGRCSFACQMRIGRRNRFQYCVISLSLKLLSVGFFSWTKRLTKQSSLWYPKSNDQIKLPNVPKLCHYRCALTKVPSHRNCRIILVGESILFCRIGDKRFVERPKNIYGGLLMSVVNYENRIFGWIGGRPRLVTVEFGKTDIKLRDFECAARPPRQLISPYFDDHLVITSHKLYLVHVEFQEGGQVSRLHVFDIYIICNGPVETVDTGDEFSILAYNETTDIGDWSILLSSFGALAVSGKFGLGDNNIFCFNPVTNENALSVFNISTTAVREVIPPPDLDDLSSVKSWIWVTPEIWYYGGESTF